MFKNHKKMKKYLILISVLLTKVSFGQEFTESAQVIDKYLEVTKIKTLAPDIKDIVLSYTSESQRGVAETEMKFAFPYKVSMGVFSNGMEIMGMIYDGEKLKRKSSFGGNGNQEPKVGKEAYNEAIRMHPFLELEYAKANITSSLLPSEKIGDMDVYVVQLTDENQKTWKDYFDVKTGFKVKSSFVNESPRGKMESNVLYENYKTFKGSEILFPAIKKQGTQMGEIVSELQSVKINKGIKEKDFEIK
jgi:hypothetical protein